MRLEKLQVSPQEAARMSHEPTPVRRVAKEPADRAITGSPLSWRQRWSRSLQNCPSKLVDKKLLAEVVDVGEAGMAKAKL